MESDMSHTFLRVLTALIMAACANAHSTPSVVKGVNIVLVHGALIDG